MRIVFVFLIAAILVAGAGYYIYQVRNPNDVYLDRGIIDDAIAEASAKDIWGIGISKVTINNYVPGTKIHAAVLVHEGREGVGNFKVSTDEPWAKISRPYFSLQPMESELIPITFALPKNYESPDRQPYRFTVLINKEQTEMIQIAYEQKWVINLR